MEVRKERSDPDRERGEKGEDRGGDRRRGGTWSSLEHWNRGLLERLEF